MGYFALNQVIALVVMLAGGALGGYTGLLLLRTSADADNNGSAVMKFRQAIAAGVAAALIVPLFLVIASVGNTDGTIIKAVFQPLVCGPIGHAVDKKATASSNTVSDADKNPPATPQPTAFSDPEECVKFVPSLMLLLAFSVIIGVSYRPFFAGISQKVLNQLNDDVQGVKDQLASNEEEPEVPVIAGDATGNATPLPPEQNKVLQALLNNSYVRRSVSGISSEQNLSKEDVKSGLDKLMQEGLVEKVPSKKYPNTVRFKLNADVLSNKVTVDKDGNMALQKK